MKFKLLIVGLCTVLILLSGCEVCKQYAERDVCVEWEKIKIAAVDKIFVTLPLDYEGDFSLPDLDGVYTNRHISLVVEKANITEVEIEKEWGGTKTVENCTKTEKRMRCVDDYEISDEKIGTIKWCD